METAFQDLNRNASGLKLLSLKVAEQRSVIAANFSPRHSDFHRCYSCVIRVNLCASVAKFFDSCEQVDFGAFATKSELR